MTVNKIIASILEHKKTPITRGFNVDLLRLMQ